MLLMGIVLAPRSAEAGCSAHAWAAAHSTWMDAGLDALEPAAKPSESQAPPIPERPAPCSGAMCSGRPAFPLSPAPSESDPVGPRALLLVPIQIEFPGPAGFPLDEPTVRPLTLTLDVFHPPRVSLADPNFA